MWGITNAIGCGSVLAFIALPVLLVSAPGAVADEVHDPAVAAREPRPPEVLDERVPLRPHLLSPVPRRLSRADEARATDYWLGLKGELQRLERRHVLRDRRVFDRSQEVRREHSRIERALRQRPSPLFQPRYGSTGARRR